MDEKDARMKITTEILNGMKVLKLYAWEDSFEKQVMHLREREVSYNDAFRCRDSNSPISDVNRLEISGLKHEPAPIHLVKPVKRCDSKI